MSQEQQQEASITDRLINFQVRIGFPIYLSVCLLLSGIVIITAYGFITKDAEKTMTFIALVTAGFGQIGVSFYTARTLRAVVARDAHDRGRQDVADERAERQDERDLERQNSADARLERAEALASERHAFELKREALRFGTRWNDPGMSDARDTLRNITEHRARSRDDLKNYIKENGLAVNHIMNFFEEMSTCCRMELVDIPTIKKQFDFVLILTWETLHVWIVEIRQEANPDIWEDTEWLYKLWKGG